MEVSLGELDLTLSQYRVLMFLSERAELASRLADSLAVTRPSVTAVVDGLVARGLVERRACEGDRRRVEHVLTEAGRRLLSAADDQADDRLATVAAQLDDRQARDLLSGLHHWRGALDRYAVSRRAARTVIR